MRARYLALLCIVAVSSCGRIDAHAQSASQLVEPYLDAQAVTEAEDLLRRPLVFDAGRMALSELSAFGLQDPALTLAANPDARLTILVGAGVDGDEALARSRFRALLAEFRAVGVQPEQLWFATAGAESGVDADEAQVGLIEGALAYGVREVLLEIHAWPGAEVFVLPDKFFLSHPDTVCTPMAAARKVRADTSGGARLRHSRRAVVVVGRDGTRLVTLPHRAGVDPQPIDLAVQTHDPRCDATP